ncbi:unnamed protein product [Protopolystoma xenopodis]|uniref:Uncharacterized protein n=1 Tax=Protopolystoma xenopodis TaxID=117903 RepID=A0A448XT74_9PLAT|nr:unnamed protein product [Protopolystoma xenopodis]
MLACGLLPAYSPAGRLAYQSVRLPVSPPACQSVSQSVSLPVPQAIVRQALLTAGLSEHASLMGKCALRAGRSLNVHIWVRRTDIDFEAETRGRQCQRPMTQIKHAVEQAWRE